MSAFRRPRFATSRSTLVSALLALTLGMTGVLAYQAVTATISHERVAVQALRENALMAAWEFSSVLRRDIYDHYLGPGLEIVAKSGGMGRDGTLMPPPPPRKVIGFPKADEYWPGDLEFFFRLDLATDELEIKGGVSPSPELTEWLRGVLKEEARKNLEREHEFRGMILHGAGDQARVLALRVHPVPGPEAETVFGFQTGLDPIREIIQKVRQEAAILPPSLIKGKKVQELVSFLVTDQAHRDIFHTDPLFDSEYKAAQGLGPYFGGMVVGVQLHPDAAEVLIIGGLPKSRLPLVLGLLLLTAGLGVAALLQLRREHELSRLRADFVSSVSHQLRTPLAQIRMFGETLQLGRVRSEEEKERSLEIIVKEAQRLTHQVDNVLLFSRAQRNDVHLNPLDTEMAPLVQEALESFCPLAQAQECRVEAHLEENVRAHVDPVALSQILLNLLENAVKYGPRDQIVDVTLQAGTGGMARLVVEDEGPGIPREDREAIFDPYSRLNRDRESGVAGSGIGLAVVRELVRRQGGEVRVEESPGGGARFVVELPPSTRE